MKGEMDFVLFTIIALFSILLPTPAMAVCPLCTMTIGAGIGLSRYLGVDDTITGTWVGGLILSSALWLISWVNQKRASSFLVKILIVAASYAIVIIPLTMTKVTGHPMNILWGVDRLLIGIIFGSLSFTLSWMIDRLLRKKNHGKVYFPYQKVVSPVAALLLTSIFFYLITYY